MAFTIIYGFFFLSGQPIVKYLPAGTRVGTTEDRGLQSVRDHDGIQRGLCTLERQGVSRCGPTSLLSDRQCLGELLGTEFLDSKLL